MKIWIIMDSDNKEAAEQKLEIDVEPNAETSDEKKAIPDST